MVPVQSALAEFAKIAAESAPGPAKERGDGGGLRIESSGLRVEG